MARAKTKSKAKARLPFTVAVSESARANQTRAVEVIAALGYEVASQPDADTVVERLSDDPPDVVLVGLPGGEPIIESAANLGMERPVIIAALAGPANTARERCEQAGADLFTLRPHNQDTLAAVLRSAEAVVTERRKVITLRGTEDMLRQRLQRYGQADQTTGFRHFDFFEQMLVMELKRAKRYGYSLAVCLVGLDPWADGGEPPAEAARQLRIRAAQAITSCIRDIDIPVDLADDRLLVFLPYTDLEGAEQVGRRVAQAVRSYGNLVHDDQTFRMSVSVGIAALRPGKPISFARLIREATAAVRASQLKGGGRVVVRK
jgi:diguanylate cyclase (GGDEF)-like protein